MSLRPYLSVAASLAVLSLGLSACGSDDAGSDGPSAAETSSNAAIESDGGGASLTIATQNFPEANLVGALYDELLKAHNYDTELKPVDTRDAYMSIFPGDVDVVPEYLAGIGDFLNTEANGEDADPVTSSDPTATLDAVKPLAEAKGITLLDLSDATSQNAFFVTKDYSESEGITALSQLAGKDIVLAGSPDCEGRADCEGGLTDVYGINITKILPLGFASPETYASVQSGESQLGLTGTIDPNLEDEGLVLLDDDKGIQPAQNYVPAISTDYLGEHPDLEALLDALMASLDNDTINELLARVTIDREQASDVAKEFLTDQGLIS